MACAKAEGRKAKRDRNMKCQSKIDVSKSNPFGGVDQILIMGKMYECELTPTVYNPMTFKQDKPYYIVVCEDGKFRKYDTENFRDIQQIREQKLNKLGI
jgi:hypothetical protein